MSLQRFLAILVFVSSCLPGVFAADGAPAGGPRRFSVGFNLTSIPDIDERAENFTAICYLRLRWRDPAQATPGGKRQMWLGEAAQEKANEVGRPGISFVNETAAAEAKHVVLTILPDGTVEYDRQFEVTLRCEFDLRSFPFDHQTLDIQIESFAYTADELLLEPDQNQMKCGRIRLPQWNVGKMRWETALVEDELEREKYHRLTVSLDIDRKPGFHIWQVFVPLFILILIASTVFFLPAEDLADRITVITTSLLTAVALSYTVRTDLPKISYLTIVDRLFVTTYAFLGAKIAGMVIVRQIVEQNPERARKIDRVARWAFPVAYIAANIGMVLWHAILA